MGLAGLTRSVNQVATLGNTRIIIFNFNSHHFERSDVKLLLVDTVGRDMKMLKGLFELNAYNTYTYMQFERKHCM